MNLFLESRNEGFRPAVALPLFGVVILLGILYFPVLRYLAVQWLNDPNYRHGLLIPVISGYLLYQRRAELKAAEWNGGTIPGVILIIGACGLLLGGTAAAELFTTRLSIPTFLLGLALFTRGWAFTKIAAFPVLFLYLMVPLPYIIYYKLTFPLQILSAKLSAGILKLIHVSVFRRGNILVLPSYTLEVVAACSGLRSLMTMITLALVLAVFSGLSLPRRAVLVACAIPAALLANTLRLTVIAFGAYVINPAFAEGFLHDISGFIVFFSGLVILVASLLILRKTQ